MSTAALLAGGPLAPHDLSEPALEGGTWLDACAVTDVLPGGGVCALLRQRQVAIFRPGAAAEFHALDNFDPFSKAFVLARGILGDRGGVPKVASPIYKQSFDLRTGLCLDDTTVSVATFPIRIRDGRLEVLIAAE
ncbi:MAG TPA: nitrite reductase small subunit NirD [Polyangia bacterium]|nr:nitrite reductase small subunit NirD [Polyangia bacterium]